MKAKDGIRLATRGFAAVSGVRAVNSARKSGDKLELADAILTLASVAVTIAIVVREIRQNDNEGDLP